LINTCDASQEPIASKGGQTTCEACKERANLLGDPINVTNGNLDQTPTDFDLGRGLRFARHYNSANSAQTGPMGLGWEHSLQWTLQRATGQGPPSLPIVFVHPPFHTPAVFIESSLTSNTYLGSQRSDGAITVDGDGTVHYTSENGTVAVFSPSNQLTSIQPVNQPQILVSYSGNATTYSNNQQQIVITTTGGMVSSVAGGGQSWSYTYDSSQNLKTVSGPDPTNSTNTITWTYSYASPGFLIGVNRSDLGQLASWTYSPAPFSTLIATADDPTLEQPLSFAYQNPDANHLVTTVSVGSTPLAVFDTTNEIIFKATNPQGPPNPSANSQAPSSVPGGAGAPVPFWMGTVDVAARWQTKTDKNGNVTSYSNYDAQGNPGSISESDSKGILIRHRGYSYHPVLKTPVIVKEASAITGVFGDKVTTFDYDDPSDPLNNPLPAPNTRPTTHLFRKTVTGKTLDASGATIPLTATTQYTYNTSGQVTSISGPTTANYTVYTYDTSGNRTGVQRYVNGPGSAHLDTTYSNPDVLGNPQTVTDPNNNTWSFTYDILSRVKTVKPPYPSSEGSGDPTIIFTYDVDGDLVRVDFPADTLGNAYFLTMGYDTKRRLTYLSDAKQNAIVYDYTAGRATEKSLYTNFTSLTSRGNKFGDSTFAYDSAGRLTQANTDPSNTFATQFLPDGNGNPVSVTDENSHVDNLIYDALNRLTEIQQVQTGFTTQFGYDPLSNVTKVTDATSKETDYTYDDLGRLVKVVSPDSGTTLYLYDVAGNLVTKIEDFTASHRTTSYSYDGLNRLTGVTFPTDPAWTFTYDTGSGLNQIGRLASVTNGTVTTGLEYTARGKVAVEHTTIGGRRYDVSYGYDAGGNLRSVNAPSNLTPNYTYSGSRPQTVTIYSDSGSATISNIAFLPFGPRTSATFPGGVSSLRHYNPRYQMDTLKVTSPSGSYYVNQSYTYNCTTSTCASGPSDPGPNLDELQDSVNPSQSQFFFYDSLDHLGEVSDLSGNPIYSYTYDAVGNRQQQVAPDGTTTYSYQSRTDRIASATGAEALNYAHDAFGNRIWAGTAAYSGTPSLKYNESNRLIEVDDPNNPTSVLGQYTYDAFGRRVQKIAGGATTLYFYDMAGHLIETVVASASPNKVRDMIYIEDELVGVADQTLNVGASALPFVRDLLKGLPPRGWLLVLTTSGALWLMALAPSKRGKVAIAGVALIALGTFAPACGGASTAFSWVHTDYIGKPIAVTNTPASGAAKLLWTASYTPFGLATPNTNPSGLGPFTLDFRFPGQVFDAESGLHYNLYRDYDPTTGRYLEADSLGLQAGINVYAYAQSSPSNLKDPTGQNVFGLVTLGASINMLKEGVPAYECGQGGSDLARTVGRAGLVGGVSIIFGVLVAEATGPLYAGVTTTLLADKLNVALGGSPDPNLARDSILSGVSSSLVTHLIPESHPYVTEVAGDALDTLGEEFLPEGLPNLPLSTNPNYGPINMNEISQLNALTEGDYQ
jgi:RHS repeat-associated protein